MYLGRLWRKLARILISIFLYIPCVNNISIDNDILGEPDIECLDQEIRVWVRTRKPFQGRIYAKGKSDDPACSKDDFSTRKLKKAHFDLGLGMCGMKSLRSYDPRGMYYGITLVISFHPVFITKVDQAFHVKCFFEEANRGLTAELGVSMIPTTEVMARHGIPGCTYSIHRSSIDELDAGKAAGTPIQFAKVGDKVLHQWHCDDQMFGILINNCYVTDGVNKKADVIDSRGCPVDPILITGIRYSADLQRAYAESQVFKFADRPGVWFFCQIQMCMRKDGMCDSITPPSCATTNAPPRGSSSSGNSSNSNSKPYRTRIASRVSTNEEIVETIEPNDENTSSTEHDGINNTLDPDARDYDQSTSGGTITRPRQHQNVHEYDVQPVATAADAEDYEPSPKSEYTTKSSPRSRKGQQRQQKLREAQSSAGGYGGYGPPAKPPTLVPEYDADNNDDEPKPVTAFGPAYSPDQLAGPYGLPPLSPIIDPSRKLPGIGRDPPAALVNNNFNANSYVPGSYNSYAGATSNPQNQGRPHQEVSTEFETNDQLGPSPPPGTLITTAAYGKTPSTTESSPINSSNDNERDAKVKKDYVDYDSDVTIPPNLTDLLANLQPQDINAQNLQRLFRDSVADRRALLQGFDVLMNKIKREEESADEKQTHHPRRLNQHRGAPSITPPPSERRPPSITPMSPIESSMGTPTHRTLDGLKPGDKVDTVHVMLDSDSHRLARDLPIQGASGGSSLSPTQKLINPQKVLPSTLGLNSGITGTHFDANGTPMIGGQLLIYDLDETPPPDPAKSARDAATDGDCVVTRHGLLVLTVATGSATAAFFCLTLTLCAKLRHSERCRRRAETSMLDSTNRSTESVDTRSLRSSKTSAKSPVSSFSNSGYIKQRRPPDSSDALQKRRNNSQFNSNCLHLPSHSQNFKMSF